MWLTTKYIYNRKNPTLDIWNFSNLDNFSSSPFFSFRIIVNTGIIFHNFLIFATQPFNWFFLLGVFPGRSFRRVSRSSHVLLTAAGSNIKVINHYHGLLRNIIALHFWRKIFVFILVMRKKFINNHETWNGKFSMLLGMVLNDSNIISNIYL